MDEVEQKFEIQKIYVKDLSFESPHAPAVFRQQWKPKTDIQLSTQNAKIEEDTYEVTLHITVTSAQDDKTAFLVDIKQSGVFLVKGFSQEQHNHLLGSYCPHTLFPFAREAISDFVSKGGFPPLILSPVNFDALYSQQLAKLKSQETATSDTKH